MDLQSSGRDSTGRKSENNLQCPLLLLLTVSGDLHEFLVRIFLQYNDRKLLLTFSIGKVVIKSVFLMPFRLVTSKHQQNPEVERDCNRYCQPRKDSRGWIPYVFHIQGRQVENNGSKQH